MKAAAAKGSAEAARLAPAVLAAVGEVNNPPPLRLPRCRVCGLVIEADARYHIGIIQAAVAAPEAALTFLLCDQCCTSQQTFDHAAEMIVRRHWPDAQDFGLGRRSGGERGAT
jgi:hypothetical protein